MIQSPTRPAKKPFSWSRLLSSWWITNRPEFTIRLPIVQIGLPALLALYHRDLDLEFFGLLGTGLVVWWLAVFIGASLNCLGDYETDRLDESNKIRLTWAIDAVGSNRLWRINLIEIGLTTLLIFALIIWLNRPLLLSFWLVGLALAVMYAFEPYKTKRRGMLNPLTIMLSCITMPMVFTYHLFLSQLFTEAMIVIGLFSLQVYSLFLVEQLGDYEEDLKTGITTPCVRYGRSRTAQFSAIGFSLAGLGMLIALGNLWPPETRWQIGLLFLAFLLYAIIIFDLWRIIRLSRAIERVVRHEKNQRQLIFDLKKKVRPSLWGMLMGFSAWIVIGGNLLL